jgi:hypothetical protein
MSTNCVKLVRGESVARGWGQDPYSPPEWTGSNSNPYST